MIAIQLLSFVAMFAIIIAILFVLMVGWIGPHKKSISDLVGNFFQRLKNGLSHNND